MAVPGGGVPLNMREVEELERMTNDFIRDMDTHAPVITSPPTGRHAARSAFLSRHSRARKTQDGVLIRELCLVCP